MRIYVTYGRLGKIMNNHIILSHRKLDIRVVKISGKVTPHLTKMEPISVSSRTRVLNESTVTFESKQKITFLNSNSLTHLHSF